LFLSWRVLGADAAGAGPVRLLVRGDDMGSSLTANEACIRTCREGVVRSVEVIVPGPWFLDAVKRLREHPEIDVGVHLTLTSEWEGLKWGPLTRAASLVDGDGYFRPMNRQRRDFPADTGFLEAKPRLDEVERELRAQIEMARRHLPRVSHVSVHMGTAVSTPELKALTERLAREYGLRMESAGLRSLPGFGGMNDQPVAREQKLVATLEALGPGTWLLVEHPGADTEEMRAIGHKGYEGVAVDRAAVTRVFTSPKVREVIKRRGIELISYSQLTN
jgi:predicted glycoside hydrolase/deacetylase ChbG (UPF0249 family)